MLGRFSVRSGVAVIVVLIAIVLPGSQAVAALRLTYTVQGVQVVASGAALMVNVSVRCTDPSGVAVSAYVTQQTSRGVQHGIGGVGAQTCDGVGHGVKVP